MMDKQVNLLQSSWNITNNNIKVISAFPW